MINVSLHVCRMDGIRVSCIHVLPLASFFYAYLGGLPMQLRGVHYTVNAFPDCKKIPQGQAE